MWKLKAGDPAPDFEAENDRGEKVRLKDLQGRKVVLFFYPKDNTPGCTKQACGFRDRYERLRQGNASVFGVSPDSARSHANFRSKHELPFDLLVDSDHSLAEAYGVWGEKSMYGRKYMGIIRSHFVIGEDGTLLDTAYKISPALSPERALAALG